MSEGVRVIGPDRAQLRWDVVDLDSCRTTTEHGWFGPLWKVWI